MSKILAWLGFAKAKTDPGPHGHGHEGSGGHGHTHGLVDPSITTTARGLWAVKWSFAILAITSALQFAVVIVSGSVALLADTIHNVGDAVTAIPLGIAFVLARRKPSARFPYGYGRAEDFAGLAVVLLILISALVAGYEAIDRLLHPKPVTQIGWLIAAGIVGFIGNEAVAVFRIRVGREINSAALVADGYHARTDGFTSLAVVLGAIGVWLGYPKADPIIGLLITIAIFGIVWQSARAVLERMLDGVDPAVTEEIRHAATHVPGVARVTDVRARWVGHRMRAELDAAMPGVRDLAAADAAAATLEREIRAHLPVLDSVRIRMRAHEVEAEPAQHDGSHREEGHGHGNQPVPVRGRLVDGTIEIVGTPEGERMQLRLASPNPAVEATAFIVRAAGRVETLALHPLAADPALLRSDSAPEEPHEFGASLDVRVGADHELLPFVHREPPGHAH